MRIAFFGDGTWAQMALERIAMRADWQVVCIVARHAAPDTELERTARDLGVPFHAPERVNTPEFLARLAEDRCDLMASMSYDQFLGEAVRAMPEYGFINCHAGALPFYRGRSVLNWAIINGERRFGVTVHYVDGGIDTGDIILQNFAPIGPDEDYAEVVERAHRLCADSLYDAIDRIASGQVTPRPQAEIHPVGTYFGRRRAGDERLDWSWSSRRIHDFVRGIAPPGPGARCLAGNRPIAVLRTRMIPEAPAYIATCGEVVGRNQGAAVVKTGDTTIEMLAIAHVESDGGLGRPMAPDLRIGTRLQGGPR